MQTEADPLDPDPPAPLRPVVEGLLYLEEAVTTIEWGEGLVLRYGGFYGPGNSVSRAPDAVMAAPIRKRQFPVIGDGGGVWSHIHIEDAAGATAVAVEHGPADYRASVDSSYRGRLCDGSMMSDQLQSIFLKKSNHRIVSATHRERHSSLLCVRHAANLSASWQ